MNGCVSVNVYFERDPKVDPGKGCPNPPSTTYIKCALWGAPIRANDAINTGQYRDQFQVVIAGSNGYTDQAAAAKQVSSIVVHSTLQPFCSSLLGYTQSPATVTATATTITTPFDFTTTTSFTTIIEETTLTLTSLATVTATVNLKRSIPTPSALSKYPASAVSSGCSLAVPLPTRTSTTTTTTVTLTAPTSTSTEVDEFTTIVPTKDYAYASATATVTATVTPTPLTGPPCGQSFTVVLDADDARSYQIYCNRVVVSGAGYEETVPAVSIDDCAAICANNIICLVFTFEPLTRSCAQYSLADTNATIVTQVASGYALGVQIGDGVDLTVD